MPSTASKLLANAKAQTPFSSPASAVVAPKSLALQTSTRPPFLVKTLKAGRSVNNIFKKRQDPFSAVDENKEDEVEEQQGMIAFVTYTDSDDEDEDEDQSLGNGASGSLFSELFDPFIHKNEFGHFLQAIDKLNKVVTTSAAEVEEGGHSRKPRDFKEDDEAVYIRVDMPGLSKEDIKIFYHKEVLTITGQGCGEGNKYVNKMFLDSETHKVNEIKAEMRNGELNVTVPKIKDEERKDVLFFKVA
ncbi:hypothetical protein ACHQM5_011219 [Ranunculus cassubicifolius]